MSLFCYLVLMTGKVTLEPIKTLAEVPEELDLYLQNVLYIEIDQSGRYLASDFPTAKVHYWEKDGSYAGSFGAKGEGPGEFSFAASLGPPMGHIYAVGDFIYIYDGGSRKVSIFDKQYQFVRRITFEKLGGKINTFHVPRPNRFLFYDSYFCGEAACRRVLLYDDKGKLLKTWRESPDKTWSRDEANNRTNLYIWEPTLAVDFSHERGEAVIGHGSKPLLDVFDRDGNLKRTLTLPIAKPLVQPEDIDEFNEQEWMKGNKYVKAIFPDEMAYFEYVLTIKEGYLVYHLSPLYGKARGYLLDFDGKMKGRFQLLCGEGGGLFSSRGKLLAALVDEEGDFHLHELKVKM
ncbi:MAG: hypothetical protein QNK37_06220 [Acidobacteriota bacterium]|nr:hypothetical protein [Acidobacteriota bacterium]